ncbi:hypothetical protein [Magnetospirillum molischianum]|uniref:Uncharacterized protein n=1 Tax=Magnetospirillum molischianum DSM 120 TaxID=1150626 RepID=H8FUS1_MAGML|nr:hypothetical protein [Magnetospirillum molischianum]CCG42109.1 hypothetical protein PHAMO_320078 [Magnetospirillum molischianum DSM 120]
MSATNRTHSIPPSLLDMEQHVDEIPCIGRVLLHMADTGHEIEGRELAWIGSQLIGLGEELCSLWAKAYRESGGGRS